MKNLIDAKNLVKAYGESPNQTFALNNVSIQIDEGDFVAIIGPSGSGKSTLMNMLGCLDRPDSGDYYLDGKLVSNLPPNELAKIRNKKFGFIFQTFNLLPRVTAIKNAQLPLVYSEVPKREWVNRAITLLEELGIGSKLKSTPSQLSGGQQQRVAIARALINEPDVIFADEPTGNLDSKTSLEIIEIFKRLNNQGKTIVMITHEADIANQAKRIVTIRDGKIMKDINFKKAK